MQHAHKTCRMMVGVNARPGCWLTCHPGKHDAVGAVGQRKRNHNHAEPCCKGALVQWLKDGKADASNDLRQGSECRFEVRNGTTGAIPACMQPVDTVPALFVGAGPWPSRVRATNQGAQLQLTQGMPMWKSFSRKRCELFAIHHMPMAAHK